MNEFASQLLYVQEGREADAFWCFERLMRFHGVCVHEDHVWVVWKSTESRALLAWRRPFPPLTRSLCLAGDFFMPEEKANMNRQFNSLLQLLRCVPPL